MSWQSPEKKIVLWKVDEFILPGIDQWEKSILYILAEPSGKKIVLRVFNWSILVLQHGFNTREKSFYIYIELYGEFWRLRHWIIEYFIMVGACIRVGGRTTGIDDSLCDDIIAHVQLLHVYK